MFDFTVTELYYAPSNRNYTKAVLITIGVKYEVIFSDNSELLYMHTIAINEVLNSYDVLSLDRAITESFSNTNKAN
jgi:hypothetical protein